MSAAPDPIDISIVMTTCSRASILRGALESLLAQTLLAERRVEMVIVDDQSTDNTLEVLESFRARAPIPVTILHGPKKGVAAARNLAAENARGTWLASFDDDELAPPDWLATLYNTALEHSADCVGGSTWLSLPPGRTLNEINRRARRLLGEVALTGPARQLTQEDLPATNNVLLRREVFETLRGFDTSFTEGGEDTNFFQRMRSAGFRIWLNPAAAVQHLIPEARLQPEAICKTAMRIGAVEARLQRAMGSYSHLIFNVCGRLAIAVVRDFPELLIARLTGDGTRALDARLSLCVTNGLLRAVPALRRGHSRFLAEMDFRMRHGERNDAAHRH